MEHRSQIGQLAFPAAVVLVVAVMVIPLPTSMLDVLIVANLSTAVLILLVAMNVRSALDFSAFPSLLLIVTLFRLGLNVSTSRAILSRGEAGDVIATFGSVVVGGSLIVGLVIFLILTLVQFVVISNGSSRVAEVTARFTLDAMPGKQMAIDADLNAGAISEDEARQRRKEVSDGADFYGAMDGASKFVKGDAIAGLVITAVNLVGGFLIGVVQMGMSIDGAISTYSLLTIGDGLVAQIPALLVSISAGLIVTRAAGEADLGSDVFAQFGRQGIAVRNGGVAVLLMALIPGLPKAPFIVLGLTLFLLGRRLIKRNIADAIQPEKVEEAAEVPTSPQQLAADNRVEPLELDIAFDLIELVDGDGDLLDRVGALRRKLAAELGFVMPAIRTRDAGHLPSNTYSIKVHGVEVGRGEVPRGRVLVMGDAIDGLPGESVIEPVFGLAARWVPHEYRVQAELAGNTVVDRSTLIVTHLSEIVRRRAGRLLSRSDVKELIESVKASDPTVVEDLITTGITTAEVQRVLATLLDDGIPIRDLVRILEAVGERARTVRSIEALVEAVRTELGPAISDGLATEGRLTVMTIAPMTEAQFGTGLRVTEQGSHIDLLPGAGDAISTQLMGAAERAAERNANLVLVCAAPLRSALRNLVRSLAPAVAVISYAEVGDHLEIEVVAQLDLGGGPMRNPNEEGNDSYAGTY